MMGSSKIDLEVAEGPMLTRQQGAHARRWALRLLEQVAYVPSRKPGQDSVGQARGPVEVIARAADEDAWSVRTTPAPPLTAPTHLHRIQSP